MPGLRLIGTAPEKASVLTFVLDGYRPEEVASALDNEGIAVRSGHHCAQPILRRYGLESAVRPSLAMHNTCGEVDLRSRLWADSPPTPDAGPRGEVPQEAGNTGRTPDPDRAQPGGACSPAPPGVSATATTGNFGPSRSRSRNSTTVPATLRWVTSFSASWRPPAMLTSLARAAAA